MIEVRWHARAGQGAKSASQVFALACLHAGRTVQAFPEYGPERSGAPMRAYTRVHSAPINRRYGITHPDAVVVLDASLLGDATVLEGVGADALVLVNSDEPPDELERRLGHRVLAIDADAIAAAHGARFVNVVMAGALAAALHEPSADQVATAVREVFRSKASADDLAEAALDGHQEMEALCPA